MGRKPKGMGTTPGQGGRKPQSLPSPGCNGAFALNPGTRDMCSILPCPQQQLFLPKQLLRPGWSWFCHGGASLVPFFLSVSSRTRPRWVDGNMSGLGLRAEPPLNLISQLLPRNKKSLDQVQSFPRLEKVLLPF